MSKESEWAQEAAEDLWGMRKDACIDTASYHLCGFIEAAAMLTKDDPDLAERIGRLMEPERVMVNGKLVRG